MLSKNVTSLRNILKKNYFSTTIIMNAQKNVSEANQALAAICHMRSTSDKHHNLKQVTEIVNEAKKQSAKFLFIPECCDFIGENRKQTLELAEPLTGQTVKFYKDLAKNNKLWLSLGGLHESILDCNGQKTDKIFNAHVVIDDCGDIMAVYRKLHLFDVDTPDFKFKESDVVAGGKEIVLPLKTPIGKLGLQICYDVRFAEASTILRKQGAEILTYPSAFAYSTGKAHWEILLRARAIENQCFVIAPAQIGWHHKKRQSYGHAMIVDPWGKIIAQCDNDKELDVVVADINLDAMKKVRSSMPCFEHRRNDMYCLTPLSIERKFETNDCNFAEYTIDKRTIFYETDCCFAFTNIRCVVPGHILVATKRKVDRLHSLTNDEISDLFQSVVKIQKMLEPIYNASSSTVTVQDGSDAGQTVKHVHFHIMPRKKGDFEHNDMIYIELNKHDHSSQEPARTLEERIAEADIYRNKIFS